MSDQLGEAGLLRIAVRIDWGADSPPPREQIAAAWGALSDAEREVLTLKFGLDGSDPKDGREIARVLKTTQTSARQRRDAAVEKMKRAVTYAVSQQPLTEQERAELVLLRVAAQAAYWHLDKYGLVQHPDPDAIKSQKRVFDLLRPHCPPIPGRL